jgi:predicted glycosyltransferase
VVKKKVFFYVQHLLGIGHLARASRVASALAANGMDITIVTGGMPVDGFPGSGIRHFCLPPVRSGDAAFSGLVDERGKPLDQNFKDKRVARLLSWLHEQKPDIVIVEAYPFGRRQLRFELIPFLEEIHKTRPRPLVVSSIRDILQERSKPGRDEESITIIERWFDCVLVHGDPDFIRLQESFPLAERIADKIRYTGLVAPRRAETSKDCYDILVSAGGGAVGAELLRNAVEAATRFLQNKKWCVLTGPNLPASEFDTVKALAPSNVDVFRFRQNFNALLNACEVSVSQAGYNTVCDALVAGCRQVLIPFKADGESEQTLRAEKLLQLGLAEVINERNLNCRNLVEAINRSLNKPAPEAPDLDLEGAAKSAHILRRLLVERG